jgi:pilus assembly protein CpaE
MPIFLLQANAKRADETAIERALRAAIPDLTGIASLDAVVASRAKLGAKAKAGEPAIAIVILPQADRAYFDKLAEFAARHANEAFLVLIGDEISASDYKRLVRGGGADWASAKADPREVLDIIARRRREGAAGSAQVRPAGGRAVTVSFIPSAGGVGNTTLAVETTAHLKTDKATRQRTICLVDLDFQTSHMCDYLDSEPRLHIAEFSSAPERLDEHLFESFRSRHDSGIDVFAAPRSKFSPESLNIHALDALLSMITVRYDLVLLVYPLPWFSWTAQIIAASDGAVITGINTIPCLRQISETLALVRGGGAAALQVAIAVNRCERTLFGSIARRKHAEMVLRDEQVFFIATRPEATESVNMGVPMMLGPAAGKLRSELAPLANFCAGLRTARLPLS